MLGKLAESDRVVPIAFHVDYFDDPWKDPFSDAKFSVREMQYSEIYNNANKLKNPGVLYLTPLIVVDGSVPMVGSDHAPSGHKAMPKAKEAVRRALAEKPGVRIELALEGKPEDARRSLEVAVSALAPALRDREVLVEVVPFEDLVSTKVERGELKGKTYTGRNVARGFAMKPAKLARAGKTKLTFPVEFPKGADARKGGVAVVVQDDATGKVHQAATVRWEPKAP